MEVKCINYGWKFYKGWNDPLNLDGQEFANVSLPHTWNNLDGQDGGGDYFRGESIYAKVIDVAKKDDKDYYLELNGVSMIGRVYVNDKFVMEHMGGFSKFRMNITDILVNGINTIKVLVDNRPNDICYPQTADFTFYGGIYRDANLIEVNKSRFNLDYYGSEGITATPLLKDGKALVKVNWYLTNASDNQIMSIALKYQDEQILTEDIKATSNEFDFTIENPHIWDGVKDPSLYTLEAKLCLDGKVLDERVIRFGCREFRVDKDGFYLNGRHYPLHGVSRHQDRLNMGWAITKKEHKEDMELIEELGANSIRLAHYQHDDYFYDLCDEAGMVVWAEIPYISVHMDNGHDNAISQMKELIIQQYNHPSICFWGISNEITIGGETKNQENLHRELNELVKSLDPNRITTLACVTMCDTHSPLTEITDIIAYNHYFGWYIGEVSDNASWLDDFRAEFKDKPLGLSEYGAEANLALHSSKPEKGDYTEEYQAIYHEEMLRIFDERPWLWGTYVWNMFDFGVDNRDEGGVKGRNNKGLVSYDRKIKKDSFFLYKAWWSDESFVHITSRRYAKRASKKNIIKVYSNLNEVSLYLNDKLIAKKTGEHIFEFEVELRLGRNKLKAVAEGCSDEITLTRCFHEPKSYQLKKEKKKVNNWFLKDGVKYEFKFPKGKFSIKDKFNTIYATEEGKKLLLELIAGAMKTMSADGERDPEKFLKGVRKLIGGMTIERIANFAGDKISPEMLYHVNEELNKIDKPEK